MGIAQRTISAKFSPKPQKQAGREPLKPLASLDTVAGWIRAHRVEKNLTEGHLGAKLGVSAGTVQAWEKGVLQPHDDHMRRLNAAFGTLR